MRWLLLCVLSTTVLWGYHRWRTRVTAPLSEAWRVELARRRAAEGVDLACWDWDVMTTRGPGTSTEV